MLAATQRLKLTRYDGLYDDLIPEGHIMRRLHDEVDYSQVYKMLEGKYCSTNGRLAKDPVLMFKYIMLKEMTNLSDKDLVEEVKMNMAYKYFLDMTPEEMPVEASTLCHFRRHRLYNDNLTNDLLDMTMNMAADKGILKRDPKTGKVMANLIIDGTHTISHLKSYTPMSALKACTKKLRQSIYQYDAELGSKIENDEDIEDLKEEFTYAGKLIQMVKEQHCHLLNVLTIKRSLNRLEELISDIEDLHIVSLVDRDARLGHKTTTTKFFGYKIQIVIDEKTGLILGAKVTSGEANDAIPGRELLKEVVSRTKIGAIIGDIAYSGQDILKIAEENGAEAITPPHPLLGSGIDGHDGFTFNKDADMFICPAGHLAKTKRDRYSKRDKRTEVGYRFDGKICTLCPLRNECLGGTPEQRAKRTTGRTFTVTKLNPQQRKLLKESKTEHFKQRYRERYKIEQCNANLKSQYSMRETMGVGINSMTVQAAVAMFTYNLVKMVKKS